MKTYYDADGNKTGTSKGCTGGCAGLFALMLLIFGVVGLISLVFHH